MINWMLLCLKFIAAYVCQRLFQHMNFSQSCCKKQNDAVLGGHVAERTR